MYVLMAAMLSSSERISKNKSVSDRPEVRGSSSGFVHGFALYDRSISREIAR
jgi:hypothetical protein